MKKHKQAVRCIQRTVGGIRCNNATRQPDRDCGKHPNSRCGLRSVVEAATYIWKDMHYPVPDLMGDIVIPGSKPACVPLSVKADFLLSVSEDDRNLRRERNNLSYAIAEHQRIEQAINSWGTSDPQLLQAEEKARQSLHSATTELAEALDLLAPA